MTAPPHTSLVCDAANQLQFLFCNLGSNSTQLGNIYECVNGAWLFYGNVGTNSSAGNPGISIYAATCSGGPPPTSVTNPFYACNEAFNLNMVLCDLSSQNGNTGIVYECLCYPSSCGWVQVANLNMPLTVYSVQAINPGIFNNSQNVWNPILQLSLLTPGWFYCLFEGDVQNYAVGSTCPLWYGISSVPRSNAWIENSLRQVRVLSISNNYVPIATLLTTAYVNVLTAPETIYVTAGVETGANGCANYQVDSALVGSSMQCMHIFPL